MAASDFFIDDLLNLSKDDTDIVPYDFLFDNSPSSGGDISISTDSSMTPACSDVQLSGGLPVPCDDLEDLDWLSDFEEDLFSTSDDVDRLFTTGPKPGPIAFSQPEIPGRVAQGELDHGHLRNRALSPKPDPIAFSKPEIPGRVAQEPDHGHSRERALGPTGPKVVGQRHCTAKNTQRRCSHCSAESTPQWRTGPMGPKTLCNACGVRYKSGRLVPEYRPAASPTFIPSKHSNLHKKVLELQNQEYRRQGPVGPAMTRGLFGGDVNHRVSPI